MNMNEKLFDKLQALCKTTDINSERAGRELSEFIGDDKVADWLITQGPHPSFPETLFEVWVVSKTFLYDYEVRKLGSLQHIIPMSKIIGISENFEQREPENYLTVFFKTAGLGTGLVLQGKLKDNKIIRGFIKAVKQQIN